MKRILCVVIYILLTGCSETEAPKKNKFLASMHGRFHLIAMLSQTSVDLNFDGVYDTNMFTEMDCSVLHPLSMYDAIVNYNDSHGEYARISVYVPTSEVYSETVPMEQCFIRESLNYTDFKANEQTGQLIITNRDESREALYGKLISGQFVDDTFYFEFDVPLFTSEGWQTVRIRQTFERYSHN